MANNSFENGRQFPHPLENSGKRYDIALQSRAQAILNTLMGILPSNYRASVASTEYANYFKAFSIELARLTMTLEDISTDRNFADVRSEFIYQTMGYLVFLNGRLPQLNFSDEEFKCFLLTIIEIYFEGSTPEAIAKGIALFTDIPFVIKENYLDARNPNSAFDISDQFGFRVEFELTGAFPPDVFALDSNIRLLLDLIRPAHTLYRLSNVFREGGEDLDGDGFPDGILDIGDDVRWTLTNYFYEDLRRYCKGMEGFSSTSGTIDNASLDTLTETDLTKPLDSVAKNATLTVLEGPNRGVYIVKGTTGTNGIQIHPRFEQAQTNVPYKVEVDRLGKKVENFVEEEDASAQFAPTTRINVMINGSPLTVVASGSLTLTASSNLMDTSFAWDLDGDAICETFGDSVTFYAPAAPGIVTIYLHAVSKFGQTMKVATNITVT